MCSFTAILPMRAGSQRVKDKNVRPINSLPLYEYIIRTVREVSLIDRLVINTDIDEVWTKFNLDSYIQLVKRQPSLAGNCSMNKVLADTLSQVDGELFVQVHATNPMLKSKTIENALSEFLKKRDVCDSIFSVTRTQKRFWNEKCEPVNHALYAEPTTQDLDIWFEENSCFYIFSRSSFGKSQNRIGEKPVMYEIDSYEAIDIDTEDEFRLVSKILAQEK